MDYYTAGGRLLLRASSLLLRTTKRCNQSLTSQPPELNPERGQKKDGRTLNAAH